MDRLDIDDISDMLFERAQKLYDERLETYGKEIIGDIERKVLLRAVDLNWMNHIDAMDELRRGIGLRAYGHHNPVDEYRNDGADMFEEMIETIQNDTARTVLTVNIRIGEEVKREQVAKITGENAGGDPDSAKPKGYSKNGLCPCGSGKKYKRCCGKNEA